jgi:hypothetical protein
LGEEMGVVGERGVVGDRWAVPRGVEGPGPAPPRGVEGDGGVPYLLVGAGRYCSPRHVIGERRRRGCQRREEKEGRDEI